jgi:hypothetical protein
LKNRRASPRRPDTEYSSDGAPSRACVTRETPIGERACLFSIGSRCSAATSLQRLRNTRQSGAALLGGLRGLGDPARSHRSSGIELEINGSACRSRAGHARSVHPRLREDQAGRQPITAASRQDPPALNHGSQRGRGCSSRSLGRVVSIHGWVTTELEGTIVWDPAFGTLDTAIVNRPPETSLLIAPTRLNLYGFGHQVKATAGADHERHDDETLLADAACLIATSARSGVSR